MALVQLGHGLPKLSAQVDALTGFAPDDYHVEEGVGAVHTRRVLERLERLRAGDELCVLSLECLRQDPAQALILMASLVDRGITVSLFTEDNQAITVAPAEHDRRILSLLSQALNREARPAAATPATNDLLSDEQVEEIRRLHRAGLSLRRIGLIFRRSPNSISALLWPDSPRALRTPRGGAL